MPNYPCLVSRRVVDASPNLEGRGVADIFLSTEVVMDEYIKFVVASYED